MLYLELPSLPRYKGHKADITSHYSKSVSTRQFNTSRASKAVNDSSTVDFAYLPSMDEIDAPTRPADTRIPILSDVYTNYNSSQPSNPPMKPQVHTVSGGGADIAVSPMAEVVDNTSVDIDPFSLTEAVGKSRFGEEVWKSQNGSKEPGVVKELWTGFLEDILGPKQQSYQKQHWFDSRCLSCSTLAIIGFHWKWSLYFLILILSSWCSMMLSIHNLMTFIDSIHLNIHRKATVVSTLPWFRPKELQIRE